MSFSSKIDQYFDKTESNGREIKKMEESDGKVKSGKIWFRNYIPNDESMKKYILESSKEAPITDRLKEKYKIDNQRLRTEFENLEKSGLFEKPKYTSDLKRDIQGEMAKLDEMTERAIGDLSNMPREARE